MKQELTQAIAHASDDLFGVTPDVELTRPDEQFGDYATNVAMKLAGKLGKKPREIAEALVSRLRTELTDFVADISIAGPGFINIRLQDAILAKAAEASPPKTLSGKTVVFDYSDPNPFKPLHAGHLYTTLVGDSVSRLVEHAGAKTIRTNYGGDVGLHVGKAMWAIIKELGGEYPDKLEAIPVEERATWLGARYVQGNSAYEDDAEAKTAIVATNKRVYQVHATDDHTSPFARIYWTCRQWSYDYFDILYKQLQVRPFDRYLPESVVTPLGVKTVEEQLQKGVYTRSDGAVVFNGEAYGLHTRVFITREGLPTYEAKEVGLVLTKWNLYHFDQSIIITAKEQEQYMEVVYKSIAQYMPDIAKRCNHLTHGTVKLQGGMKMSSRKGNVVTAMDMLEAARAAGKDSGMNPSEETILAAIKYAFVKNRIGGDIIYDPKESIALEGNSGPYLQYAHARACSIVAKANGRHAAELIDLQPAERSLLRKIAEYTEVVERATVELLPHYIASYLYELAQLFNSFYEHNRVIGDEREAMRLRLVQHYADKLRAGLELLGIAAPDKM